jgi:hypothetical protein
MSLGRINKDKPPPGGFDELKGGLKQHRQQPA